MHARKLPESPWAHAPLEALCAHIVTRHHDRTRRYLTRARVIIHELVDARPGRLELVELARVLQVLEQDLSRHMLVEEMVLFPYVDRLVAASERGGAAVDELRADGGGVDLAQHDHENAGILLAGIRELADKLRVKGDDELQRLFDVLVALETDLQVHAQLEDDVLFPRLRALEASLTAGVRGMSAR